MLTKHNWGIDYLGLRHTGLKMLPLRTSNLRSLQTLDINNLKQVPNVIWNIKNEISLHQGARKSCSTSN